MKTNLKALALALTLTLPAPALALTITTSTDGDFLANSLVGSGVTISNVSLIGASTQQGTFSDGLASGIGIESGVILTSGSANLAPGPNDADGAGAGTGTGSDSDLAGLIPGYTIYDKNVLEFDFTTTSGNLYFSYVFASEEYNEYVNSAYNDVFGFFVNGVNIALIPGTSTPVSINSVNCGYSVSGSLPGTDPENCDLFNNNDLSNGGPFFNIQYDGFTNVFTASALNLGAGTHHIKLAIADAGDDILDSAVFLRAGSFTDVDPDITPVPVPEPASLALLGIGLAGLGVLRRRKTV
jgi:hypothetical protein